MGFRACLLDVYETVLSCDFSGHATGIPLAAGVAADGWNAAFLRHATGLNDGTSSLSEVYALALRDCGVEPDDSLLLRLLDRSRDILVETTELHADTVPFLEMLRGRGIPIAFVSNCAENTRPLLDHLGLSAMVDSMVLSCEVRSAKPEPAIYRAALDELGVAPQDAIFVDDQPAFCAGAEALGITAVRIQRDARAGEPGLVRSLTELDDRF